MDWHIPMDVFCCGCTMLPVPVCLQIIVAKPSVIREFQWPWSELFWSLWYQVQKSIRLYDSCDILGTDDLLCRKELLLCIFLYFSLLLITVKGAVVWKYWGLRNSNLINRYAFMSVFMISVCNSWKKFTFNSKLQSTMMYFPLKVYLWGPPFSAQKNPQ